jgi:ABC-type nitrate/sulfonate/bicarbonate transport system permease component
MGQRMVIYSIVQTLLVTIIGFCLGIVGAVSFGSLLGGSRWAYSYLAPSFHFFRSLPVVLYVPITLVLLGSDIRVPVILSAIITTLYGAVPVIKAVRNYDPEKILLLRARGYSGIGMIVRFVLPEIIAALATSMSITITLSLAVTVVAEMLLPSLGGIGTLIIHSKEFSAYDALWAYTCLLGGCGFFLHKTVMHVWCFAVPWVMESED